MRDTDKEVRQKCHVEHDSRKVQMVSTCLVLRGKIVQKSFWKEMM